jgi:hypothetical protein
MTLSNDHTGAAWKIAKQMEESGYDETQALSVIGMALGIYVESIEGSHRGLLPLSDALLNVAQKTFDAMRAGRNREAGTA